MRVVLVGTGVHPIPPTGYGGVERTLDEFASALRRADIPVRIFQEVRGERPFDEYRFAWNLRRRLHREDDEVVHASTPVVAQRLGAPEFPFVYTSHSRHWFVRTTWTDRWGYYLERRAVRRASHVIALTPAVRAKIDTVLPVRNRPMVSTIPIGVDIERFSPPPTKGDPAIVLGVGVIAPWKRWHLAVDALEGTALHLRLVGPVVDRSYAKALEHRPNVTLVGEVSDSQLLEEYRRAGLLVHPSAVEVLPGAVLQALACGLPVIGGSAVAGLFEDGAQGRVLDDSSEERWVRDARTEMVRVAHDESLRTRWAEAARRWATDHYAWSVVAEAHRPVYESVARESDRLTARNG